MWQEIKLNDSVGITNFIGVQKTCSDHYATTWTTTLITNKFNKGLVYGLRAFIYTDADYEINLAVGYKYFQRVTDTTTMVLNTVGIGKYKTIDGAVKIIMPKIDALAKEYKANFVIAGWGDDVYPRVQEFYQGMANNFVNFGFKTQKLDFVDGVYTINVGR